MRTVIASIVAALAVIVVPTAAADRPEMFTERLTVTTPGFNFSCVPYGYSFNALATFTVERRYIRFYDASGRLVKEIRHIDFDGTLYRSDDLSKTIPYAGKWTRTLDVGAGTVANTGLFRYSRADGSGTVRLDAGRTVTAASPPFAVHEDTGPTQDEWRQGVCEYLAS